MLLYATMWLGGLLAQTTPFDVASIKPNRSGSGSTTMRTSHGQLTASNVTVRMLIQKGFHLKQFQISGGPEWLDTERYDIAAKTERADISDDNLWLSLEPLLADRFRLRFHRTTKQLPVYSLVTGKGGPKLKAHTGDDELAVRISAGSGRAKLEAKKASMVRFADALGGFMDRTVLDKTGLSGEYDVRLEWAQDHPGEESASMLGTLREELGLTGPSIFTALQEQLGLRLESAKGPVEIIVVDSVEKPSAN